MTRYVSRSPQPLEQEFHSSPAVFSDDVESEDDWGLFDPMTQRTCQLLVNSPQEFIRIIHHPHSDHTTSTIIPLDEPLAPSSSDESRKAHNQAQNDARPWAPFRTRADFEFARLMVTKACDKETVETLLEGCNGRWCQCTAMSLRDFADYKRSLAAARHFGVRVREKQVVHHFKGQDHTFTFQFRDPWNWLFDLVTEPTLNDSIFWYPVQKWLHHKGRITRIYDELNSGDRWWQIQDSLPRENGIPHCFLPLHLWLDKSDGAKTVTKHPIILRAGFLPSAIRNGSGNGGGILIGYMPKVGEPNSTTENEDDSMTSIEFARFKREVYHEVLRKIFHSISKRSRSGEAVICGDEITRVLYPGIFIQTVDGEEAYCLCGTRGAKANYPCPRCLTNHHSLTDLTAPITLRKEADMQALYNQVLTLPATAAEKVLRNSGLHLVKNAFWKISHSDPYLAYSYDMLHAMDSGEWGKHQWVMLTDVILNTAEQSQLSSNMREVPRWPLLRHFDHVTGIDLADGNSYRDILKCIVFCLVNILPANSPIIHCFRTLAVIRSIAVLRPVSEEHISYLMTCLPKYQKFCAKLTQLFNKNYEYLTHHSLVHLPFDLREKGSTDNYTTRPGEGFQQEVQQACDQTNFRDTDSQMTRIDENQKAIARITLSVNEYDKAEIMAAQEQAQNDGAEAPVPITQGEHWKFGAPLRRIPAMDWETAEKGTGPFHHFERRLREFLREFLPMAENPPAEILVKPYQCLYLRYRSLENREEKQDILRCNANFFGRPRHDCVVVNTNPISFARLHALFSYRSPTKNRHDMALVTYFTEPSVWKPKTKWDGCRVLNEGKADFVLIRHLVRGCHMIPAFDKAGKVFYLNDLVDSDAFLRFFLEQRLGQTDI